ncbi:mitochondrial 37S ribosomal protein rsm10 [Boothiomyces sp. JEL0866]|nr:mitochondrial 37S ribosomal protein rsm10 [Boothiomyces sp. JEL0866]
MYWRSFLRRNAYSLDNLKISDLQLKPIQPPPKTHNHLVCNMILSGYMPDHLDFVTYFARYSAHQMSLPTSEIIHLPTKIKKWTVMKGPFVHAKSKQVFERKTYKRLIQVFDSHPESLKEWIKYVNESLPAGIDLETERFERKSLSYVDTLPDEPKDSYETTVRENIEKYLKEFSK